jgi:hypothetical protein
MYRWQTYGYKSLILWLINLCLCLIFGLVFNSFIAWPSQPYLIGGHYRLISLIASRLLILSYPSLFVTIKNLQFHLTIRLDLFLNNTYYKVPSCRNFSFNQESWLQPSFNIVFLSSLKSNSIGFGPRLMKRELLVWISHLPSCMDMSKKKKKSYLMKRELLVWISPPPSCVDLSKKKKKSYFYQKKDSLLCIWIQPEGSS